MIISEEKNRNAMKGYMHAYQVALAKMAKIMIKSTKCNGKNVEKQ